MPQRLHLGKKAFVPDDRDFTFKTFSRAVGVELPTPPDRFGHGLMYGHEGWGMLGNGPDATVGQNFMGAGCCVLSDAGHATMLTNRLAGRDITITGRNTIDDYSAVTGYVIGDDATDNGTEIREALKYRQKVGVVDAQGRRHKIGAYLKIDPKDWDLLMQAVFIFSAVSIGFNFPDSAWDQFDKHEPWDVVSGWQFLGGHDVLMTGRSSKNVGGCVSWGRRVGLTREFYEATNEETWAIVFPEQLRAGKTQHGYTLAGLNEALTALAAA